MTHGDTVVGTMKSVGLQGDFLPWRDVLHQGPVPAELSPGELRRVRARFLLESRRDWFMDGLAYFTARDRALVGADDVLLWFESDLYDQLQLLQILDLLGDGRGRRRLICIGSFPGYSGFVGLGQLDPDEFATLVGTEHDISAEELDLGQRAWGLFAPPIRVRSRSSFPAIRRPCPSWPTPSCVTSRSSLRARTASRGQTGRSSS